MLCPRPTQWLTTVCTKTAPSRTHFLLGRITEWRLEGFVQTDEHCKLVLAKTTSDFRVFLYTEGVRLWNHGPSFCECTAFTWPPSPAGVLWCAISGMSWQATPRGGTDKYWGLCTFICGWLWHLATWLMSVYTWCEGCCTPIQQVVSCKDIGCCFTVLGWTVTVDMHGKGYHQFSSTVVRPYGPVP